MPHEGPEWDENTRLVAVGQLILQAWLWNHESRRGDQNRAGRMRVVQLELAEAIERAGLSVLDAAKRENVEQLLDLLPAASNQQWSKRDRLVFLAEMVCNPPFAPAVLEFSGDERKEALDALATRVGTSSIYVEWISSWHKSAAHSHRHADLRMPILIGAGTVLLVAATAGAAAPMIAPMLAGTGAGGAAILGGLATAGFGSVASGGLGVVGGTWILTGAGAAIGGAVAGTALTTATMLGAFDRESAAAELAKAQTTFKVVYIDGYATDADGTTDTALAEMRIQRSQARTAFDELARRNEDHAPAVKHAGELVNALDEAIDWMNERDREAPKEQPPKW